MTYAIHDFMTEHLGLRGNELLLYALIYAFSQDGSGCFYGSNAYAAKKVGCARENVNRILTSLEGKGLLIRCDGQHRGRKTIDYTAVIPAEGCDKSSQCDEISQCDKSSQCDETSQAGVTKHHTRCDETSHNNKEILKGNINNNNIKKDTIQVPNVVGKEGVGEKPAKVSFADYVSMTQREHDLLVEAYGEADTATLIDILNSYKGSKGVTYKSDYLAIKNWVVKRLAEDKADARKRSGVRTNERGETATVASFRAAEESFRRIADRHAERQQQPAMPELPPIEEYLK